MAITFTTLLIGFILLDLAHFGFPVLTKIAAFDLIICALGAWYMMGSTIINDVAGCQLIKTGKPWIKLRR